ncbi:MAG: tetratricopeptide repeat protein [Planctomycetota bacterium]
MEEKKPKSRRRQKILIFSFGYILGIVTCIALAFIFYFYITRSTLVCEVDYGITMDSKFHNKFIVRTLMLAEKELDNAKDEYDRWITLDDLAVFLIDTGQIDEAEKYATELLELATKYKKDWNYGNAIHKGHIALGRIALRRGRIDSAKGHLLEAGRTPGSPQLDSFGPNMLLAKELFEEGQKDTVIKYLQFCDKFWSSGKWKIKKWQQIIQEGRTPYFGSNYYY